MHSSQKIAGFWTAFPSPRLIIGDRRKIHWAHLTLSRTGLVSVWLWASLNTLLLTAGFLHSPQRSAAFPVIGMSSKQVQRGMFRGLERLISTLDPTGCQCRHRGKSCTQGGCSCVVAGGKGEVDSPRGISFSLRSSKSADEQGLLRVSTPCWTSFSLPFSAECRGGRGDRHRCYWQQTTPLFNTPSPNRMQPSRGHHPDQPSSPCTAFGQLG